MKTILLRELEGVNVINLLRTEFYKMFRSKSFWVILIISTVLGIMMSQDGKVRIAKDEIISISFYCTCLLILFSILLGSISFGSDFINRTINNEVCAGHNRLKIFFCKVIVYFIGVNLIILIAPFINLILNCSLHKFISYGFINEGAILIKTFFITSLLGMAASSVSIFIAFIFRDVGKTVGISVFMYILNVQMLGNSSIKTTLLRFLPLSEMRLILYRPLIKGQFEEAGLVSIVTIIFFLAGSYLCFKRSELR